MRRVPSGFDIKNFLQKGALFGSGDAFWLFWGSLKKSQLRPLTPSLFVSDFFLENDKPWWTFENAIQIKRRELSEIFEEKKLNIQWQETSRLKFDQQYDKVQDWLQAKKLNKAVPYVVTQSLQKVGETHIESFIASAAKKNQGYLYGAWESGEGLIGLSPELLVSQNKNKMGTMAIAGTCLLDEFQENPDHFLKNQKEINEHEFVVADLTTQLKNFKGVKFSQRTVQSTPKLVHFKTEVSWETNEDIKIQDLISLLHPTPALGCSPRENVFSYMKELDDIQKRERFGAPFGISKSSDEAEIIVAIRNLSWNQEVLKMSTGCGVVLESQKDKEWQEVLNKKKSIQEIFNLL